MAKDTVEAYSFLFGDSFKALKFTKKQQEFLNKNTIPVDAYKQLETKYHALQEDTYELQQELTDMEQKCTCMEQLQPALATQGITEWPSMDDDAEVIDE